MSDDKDDGDLPTDLPTENLNKVRIDRDTPPGGRGERPLREDRADRGEDPREKPGRPGGIFEI